MIYLAYAASLVACVAGCVYLVMNGHPWFALFVLACVPSIESRDSSEATDAR